MEDAHNQVPVELSNLQLYHRSEFSMPSHCHHDFEERLDTIHTAGYVALMNSVIQLKANKHHVLNMTTTFSMVAMNSIASVMRCSRVTNISRYAIFNFLPKSNI